MIRTTYLGEIWLRCREALADRVTSRAVLWGGAGRAGAGMVRMLVLVGTLLTASAASADLANDIVDTWTVLEPMEMCSVAFTFNADGTYQRGMVVGEVIYTEQGIYVVSGGDVTLHPSEDGPYTLQNVTVTESDLSFYDPQTGVTVHASRGIVIVEVFETSWISGTVYYEGEVPSGITVAALVQRDQENEPFIAGSTFIAQPGPYTIGPIQQGTYVVYAALGSSLADEPVACGYHAVGGEVAPVTVLWEEHLLGIDIILRVSAVQKTSWGAVKAMF